MASMITTNILLKRYWMRMDSKLLCGPRREICLDSFPVHYTCDTEFDLESLGATMGSNAGPGDVFLLEGYVLRNTVILF